MGHRLAARAVADPGFEHRAFVAALGQYIEAELAHGAFRGRFRVQAAQFNAVNAASLYLARFALDDGWRFIGSDALVGRSRFYLAYESPAGVLVDVLKHSMFAERKPWIEDQLDGYLRDGPTHWPSRFLGVRECALTDPSKSRWHAPTAAARLLSQTTFAQTVRSARSRG